MNYDAWVLIAQIAIPSLIALLAAYWQIRVAKAIANPKEKRPFFQTRFGKFLKEWGIVILFVTGCLNSISSVIFEMNTTEPITRYTIFRIAFHLSSTVFFLSGIATTLIYKNLNQLVSLIGDFIRFNISDEPEENGESK